MAGILEEIWTVIRIHLEMTKRRKIMFVLVSYDVAMQDNDGPGVCAGCQGMQRLRSAGAVFSIRMYRGSASGLY
jgi:hypothetical protein